MSALLGGEVDDDGCAEAPMMPYISFVQASPGEEDDEGCAEAPMMPYISFVKASPGEEDDEGCAEARCRFRCPRWSSAEQLVDEPISMSPDSAT